METGGFPAILSGLRAKAADESGDFPAQVREFSQLAAADRDESPARRRTSGDAPGACYWMVWQRSQSCLMTEPSFALWLSSWHRKQPGNAMWPMLFGYVPHPTFMLGNTLRR